MPELRRDKVVLALPLGAVAYELVRKHAPLGAGGEREQPLGLVLLEARLVPHALGSFIRAGRIDFRCHHCSFCGCGMALPQLG